jgi:MGT family glycosyltransferase
VLVAPPELAPKSPPDNFIVRAFVPQLELLAHVHAVVSHGGHNTVAEALAHGLPLVVTPIKYDQPMVAQQVADAGAGIRLKFGRVKPSQLRDAVLAVLDDDAYRTAARRIRASFEAAGGAAYAASRVEQLL